MFLISKLPSIKKFCIFKFKAFIKKLTRWHLYTLENIFLYHNLLFGILKKQQEAIVNNISKLNESSE